MTGISSPGAPNPGAQDTAGQRGPMGGGHTDWLHHRLTVTGPWPDVGHFRRAAAGSGVVPWHFDLDRMEEDWFHLLVAAPDLQDRRPGSARLSASGARILAAQLRDAVARRHQAALARVGRSFACPLDLHALREVPLEVLRLGPDDPAARAWLWQRWGTTQALRHVTEFPPGGVAGEDPQGAIAGQATMRLGFWSADWTPWRALAHAADRWPALRFEARPSYGAPS